MIIWTGKLCWIKCYYSENLTSLENKNRKYITHCSWYFQKACQLTYDSKTSFLEWFFYTHIRAITNSKSPTELLVWMDHTDNELLPTRRLLRRRWRLHLQLRMPIPCTIWEQCRFSCSLKRKDGKSTACSIANTRIIMCTLKIIFLQRNN